jgi:hypothetical protein
MILHKQITTNKQNLPQKKKKNKQKKLKKQRHINLTNKEAEKHKI